MKKLVIYFFLLLPSFSQAAMVLGVHPYLDAQSIIKRFQPLADYLSSQIGVPVEVRVGKDYGSHIQAIGKDNIDIAYLGPASYEKIATYWVSLT